MGKASSNKKVARAASTSGGRTAGGRTPWAYYLAIAVIALLGTAMVYTSRQHRLQKVVAAGATAPVAGQDHWHVAYAFYLCNGAKGEFIPPIPDQTDPVGIHTHADGVIHVHPFTNSVAGKNAVLGVFTKTVGVTLNAGELKVPSFKGYTSHTYHDTDSCGGKPGRVQVQVFTSPADTTGTLWKGDPRQVPLKDKQMITIAFMPKGDKIPPPPASDIDHLLHLNDLPSTAPTTTTVPGTTTTAPSSTTSTSVKK